MRTEMNRLIEMLNNANIPFELTTDINGNKNNQVWYPSYKNSVCDVICHQYSYGGDKGLLEIMGLLTEEEAEYDSVVGYLTAENVFKRIENHYKMK